MQIKKSSANYFFVMLLAAIAGCGGGGGGGGINPTATTSGSNATTTSFPLQKAYASLNTNGFQRNVNVTGTATVNGVSIPVTGSLQVAQAAAITNTTFNGQAADEVATTVTGTVSVEGQTLNISQTNDEFYSPSGQPLGATSNGEYCITTSYNALPSSINIGQSGSLATFACYSDSTKSTLLGTSTTTYVITAGASSGTANLQLVSVGSNAQGQQVTNSTMNFQMDGQGDLTFSSITVTATVNGVTVTYTSG